MGRFFDSNIDFDLFVPCIHLCGLDLSYSSYMLLINHKGNEVRPYIQIQNFVNVTHDTEYKPEKPEYGVRPPRPGAWSWSRVFINQTGFVSTATLQSTKNQL